MLGAAPTCKLYRGVPSLLAIVAGGIAMLLIGSANAHAEVQQARPHVVPVWGVALDGRQSDQPNLELLAQAKAAGVNAIVTDPKRWSSERHRRLANLARGLGMFLIEPRRRSEDAGSGIELRPRCQSGLRVHHPCALVAKTAREAVELARRGTVDYVVVRLGSPTDLRRVNAKRSTRTELIAVLTVGESAKLDSSWDQAIDSALRNPRTTLATGLSGAFAATAIRDYFSLMQKHDAHAATFDQTQGDRGSADNRDRLPPTAPLAATVASASTTSVDLKWTASSDNVGVAGYGIYLSATSIGSTPATTFTVIGSTSATTFTVNGLQCGSTYTFAIDAYDEARNRSQKVTVTGATSSCPLPPPASPSPSPSSPPSSPSLPSSPPPTPSSPSSQPSAPSAPAGTADKTRPSRPDGLAASGVTQSSMTLTWNPSSDNVGVARYEISNGNQSLGTTTITSYLVTGLSCATTYQLSVTAYDAAGNNSVAATIRAATAPCSSPSGDIQPPTSPGNVHLVSNTGSSVTLAWTASGDNVGVTGYGVYRDGNLAGSTNSTSYTVAGLACSTNYTIAVDAYDAAGNHSQRATMTTSTSSCPPAADTQAPSVPTNVHVTGATPTSVTLAWTASTDNVGVSGYTVYNGTTASGNATSTSYTVVGLSCAATYALAVDAFDTAGNRSSKASVTATTNACPPPPPPPVDNQPVAAFTYSPQKPVEGSPVSFDASSSTCADTPCSYVWEDDGPDGPGGTQWPLGTGRQLSYSFIDCPCTIWARLNVTDADGDKATTMTPVSVAQAAAPPPPTADAQPPTVPGGLRVTAATANSITVAWTASTDNVGVAGYGLYRNGTSTGTTASTSATFSGLVCGTGYTLAVDAYDAAGNRSSQANISAPTSACPPSPPGADAQPPTVPSGLRATGATANSITVAWTASTDNVGVAGYGLYRNGTSTGTTASTSATFSGLVCGAGYTLAVDAYDAAGNRSAKASVTASTSACPPPADTQPPTVPGGLKATAATATSITVAWTASTDNVGVTGYGVYNGSSNVGSTASTSYSVSSLSCGTAYMIAVDAYDAAGNRSGKASVSASTAACSAGPSGTGVSVSTTGNDSTCVRGDQSKPCLTFSRAYQIASCGDTVQVAAGSYPTQTVNQYAPHDTCGSRILFRPSSGATVRVAGLKDGEFPGTQGASHIEFQDMSVNEAVVIRTTDSTLTRLTGSHFYANTVTNFTVQGGNWGPCTDCNSTIEPGPNSNVTVTGNTFHDYRITPNSGNHLECLFIWNTTTALINANKFYNCEFFDIEFEGTSSNLTIQNNWFDAPFDGTGNRRENGFHFGASTAPTNVTIRFNSFNDQATWTANYNIPGLSVIGNIMKTAGGCGGGPSVYKYNVYRDSTTCGGTGEIGLNSLLPYVNGSAGSSGDYHLAGTPLALLDRVPPSAGCPATDIDGAARPVGPGCDVGSDER